MTEKEQIIQHLTEAIRPIEKTGAHSASYPGQWDRYLKLRDIRFEYSKQLDLSEVIYADEPPRLDAEGNDIFYAGDNVIANVNITEEMLGNDDIDIDPADIVVPSETSGKVTSVAEPGTVPYKEDLRYLVRFAVGGEWWVSGEWILLAEEFSE